MSTEKHMVNKNFGWNTVNRKEICNADENWSLFKKKEFILKKCVRGASNGPKWSG